MSDRADGNDTGGSFVFMARKRNWSMGVGLRGDARQRDPRAALFVVYASN